MLLERAVSETFTDVEGMLLGLTNVFWRKYVRGKPNRGTFGDLLSVTHEAFMIAYHSYDSSEGTSFSTWVYTRVFYALKTHIREESKRAGRLPARELPADDEGGGLFPKTPPDYATVRMLAKRLSEDARRVASIALTIEEPGDTTRMIRAKLYDFLEWSGWSVRRIKAAYHEIRHSL